MRAIDAGTQIFHEGEDADGAYLVVEGRVEVRRRTPRGGVDIAVLTDGDVLGEMALLSDGKRSADAVAIAPTRLLLITRDEFDERVTAMDPVMRQIARILVRRLREANDRLAKLDAAHPIPPEKG